jgi:hypothetical protein
MNELGIITNTDEREIEELFRHGLVPDEHKDPDGRALYDKLYDLYVLVVKCLEWDRFKETADKRMRQFLDETEEYRGMNEEPPWYPLTDLPGRTLPVWQPKNLREYLLEGRMIAVAVATQWRREKL